MQAIDEDDWQIPPRSDRPGSGYVAPASPPSAEPPSKSAVEEEEKKKKKRSKKRVVPAIRYIDRESKLVSVREMFDGDGKSKGLGLRAEGKIQENWRIPYNGLLTDEETFQALQEEAASGRDPMANKYLVDSGVAGWYEDANPALFPAGHEPLGGRVNEPSARQKQNMILTSETFEGEKRAVFVAVREIEPGEELTALYGDQFKRFGYRPGGRGKLPWWWHRRHEGSSSGSSAGGQAAAPRAFEE